jgi:hypothetical protein
MSGSAGVEKKGVNTSGEGNLIAPYFFYDRSHADPAGVFVIRNDFVTLSPKMSVLNHNLYNSLFDIYSMR